MGPGDLNRTLLLRQHLLERTDPGVTSTVAMVRHLVGLQAQDALPPYLGLAARTEAYDPHQLSEALADGRLVRLVVMRGTIHLLAVEDAHVLRAWVQPSLSRRSAANALTRPARGIPVGDVAAATRRLLADGPLPSRRLGELLAEEFPGVPAAALSHVARDEVPLVQLPPRGLWRRSGGVLLTTLEEHAGRPGTTLDVPALVRRYLRAFGPATPADLTTWSGVTRLGPVLAGMREELVPVDCADGRTRFDVPGAPYASGDQPAPVRLLGCYDNLWLSHASRDLVTPTGARARWAGANGGVAHTVFVDGRLVGLWRLREGRVALDGVPPLGRVARGELDEEVSRVEALLQR
jgi:hypothetical protein